jgi:hypothetical protein
MIHNGRIEQIKTEKIIGDEFWSFVQKNRNTALPIPRFADALLGDRWHI